MVKESWTSKNYMQKDGGEGKESVGLEILEWSQKSCQKQRDKRDHCNLYGPQGPKRIAEVRNGTRYDKFEMLEHTANISYIIDKQKLNYLPLFLQFIYTYNIYIVYFCYFF